MDLKGIYEKDWIVSKNLKITQNRVVSLQLVEQECHFNVLKVGFDNTTKDEILVCCSHQNYITKLSKSSLFTLTDVVYSCTNKDFVLEVKGILDKKGLNIRKKGIILSDKEKSRRAINLQRLKAKN